MINAAAKPFQADRTGRRDAHAAIQAALNQAARQQLLRPSTTHRGQATIAAAEPVLLPPGRYRIDKPIWIEGTQSLIGQQAILESSDAFLVGEAVLQGRPYRQHLEGLTFVTRDVQGETLSQAVMFRGPRLEASLVTIRRCHFHGITGPAVHFGQRDALFHVEQCVFDRCRHTLEVEAARLATLTDCIIDAAPIADPFSEHIRVRFGRLSVRSCTITSQGIAEPEHDVEPAHIGVLGQSMSDGVHPDAWAAGVTLHENIIMDQAYPLALVNVWTPGLPHAGPGPLDAATQTAPSQDALNPPPAIQVTRNQWTQAQAPDPLDPPPAAVRLMRLPSQLVIRDNTMPPAAHAATWSSLAEIDKQTAHLDPPRARPPALTAAHNFGGPYANTLPDPLALYAR